MAYKTDSWKEKVDPAFVKFIKFYLEFLKVSQLPGNRGYLALYDRNLRTLEIEGFPSIASVYEQDESKDSLIDLCSMVDETFRVEELKEFENQIKKEIRREKHNIFTYMSELSGAMQGESREYYREAFKHLVSREKYNEYISGRKEDDVKELVKKAQSDLLSCQFNLMVMDLADKKEEIRRNIQLRNFRYSTRMIKRNLFYTWDAVSIMVNGASLKELYRGAKNGDNDCLFKLIQVDKTFFDHKWFRMRINEAAYSGNLDFFESLGEAIRTDPLRHDTRQDRLDRLFVVIKFFWNFGLYRLSDYELHGLLISDSIYSELGTHEDVESFIKWLQRHRTYLPK